jgi:hypothetical protein
MIDARSGTCLRCFGGDVPDDLLRRPSCFDLYWETAVPTLQECRTGLARVQEWRTALGRVAPMATPAGEMRGTMLSQREAPIRKTLRTKAELMTAEAFPATATRRTLWRKITRLTL